MTPDELACLSESWFPQLQNEDVNAYPSVESKKNVQVHSLNCKHGANTYTSQVLEYRTSVEANLRGFTWEEQVNLWGYHGLVLIHLKQPISLCPPRINTNLPFPHRTQKAIFYAIRGKKEKEK